MKIGVDNLCRLCYNEYINKKGIDTMPIKGNNIAPPARTKSIYINWSEQRVYTAEDYEKHLDEMKEEMLEDESLLGEWILDNFNYHEVGRIALESDYREYVYAEYEKYCRERIQDDEDGEWEEVEVTF
jgi:hypothetical protein